MCLIAFSWQPQWRRLLLLANRDEFYARASQGAHWWPDAPEVWAGRDLEAGGTWLGVNRKGRFAALTNVREGQMQTGKRSRGELVAHFLTSALSPQAYLAHVLSQGDDYAGFNLLVGDINLNQYSTQDAAKPAELWYGSNRDPAPAQLLTAGTYGLSNAQLNTPWPKLTRLKQGLMELNTLEEAPAFALLDDNRQALPDALPNTGVSQEWEQLLSSAFIHTPDYGTRAQTYLCIQERSLLMVERSRGQQAQLLSEQRLQLEL